MYRDYVTTVLRGGIPEISYRDLISPVKQQTVETKDGEEIADDIMSRAGLSFGE